MQFTGQPVLIGGTMGTCRCVADVLLIECTGSFCGDRMRLNAKLFIFVIFRSRSYVLTGTDKGMATTFGSTCHGAGRAMSRAKSRYILYTLCPYNTHTEGHTHAFWLYDTHIMAIRYTPMMPTHV